MRLRQRLSFREEGGDGGGKMGCGWGRVYWEEWSFV